MEQKGPVGKYQVVVLKAPDPDAVAQIVSQRLGKPVAEIRKLVSMAPAVVATDMDALWAEDLVGTIKSIGANAEKRLIPTSLPCSFHPNQPGKTICRVCNKVICVICLRSAKGQPICPDCTGESKKIEIPFPWARLVVILLIVGALGGAFYLLTRPRKDFTWDRPYRLAVVAFMVELPPEWRGFAVRFNESTGGQYVDMQNHTLPDAAGWFQREYERYGGTLPNIIELKTFGPFDEMEPPAKLPAMGDSFIDRYFDYQKAKSYFDKFNKSHDLDFSDFDGVIYVQFVEGDFPGFEENWMSRHGSIGYTKCYLKEELVEADIMIVLHELLHLLNGLDHYGSDGAPVHPDGFAQPFEDPLYPQRFAEVMAGRIPLEQNDYRNIAGLKDLRLGIHTAHEIGWINEARFQQYLSEKNSPPME